MSQLLETEELIEKYQRRLQILKEKKATLGISTPPEILIEIEDIEGEIAHLQEESKGLNQPRDSSTKSSREIQFETGKPKKISPVEIVVAKIGLAGTIISGLLGLIGVVFAAYVGFLTTQAPIKATQTVKAKSAIETSDAAESSTLPSTATPLPHSTSLPFVLLMDSSEPLRVYNPPGTNTDDIRDILSDLPIKHPMEEVVFSGWDRSEIINQLEPDLIIIHSSAFCPATMITDPLESLDTFLWAMELTHTKFLIYSRTNEFMDMETRKQIFVDDFPFLRDRVDVLFVPEGKAGHCSYWECPDVREELRKKVKSMLALE